MNNLNRHKNYELLNLIGYGLAKFGSAFTAEFGFKTKNAFYQYCVDSGVAETTGTVKNRMDLFDHFFPGNGRKGWWQKGNMYIHRKIVIDSLFGDETAKGLAGVVKLFMQELPLAANNATAINKVNKIPPIVKSRFRQLQETGLRAEMFFLYNYNSAGMFENGLVEDARLYGDGYDFQISANHNCYLVEVKGIRGKQGEFRLTGNEYKKARKYKDDYILTLVLDLDGNPFFELIENPIEVIGFEKREFLPQKQVEYHAVFPLNAPTG